MQPNRSFMLVYEEYNKLSNLKSRILSIPCVHLMGLTPLPFHQKQQIAFILYLLLTCLKNSYIYNQTIYGLLFLIFVLYKNIFEIHPCYCF